MDLLQLFGTEKYMPKSYKVLKYSVEDLFINQPQSYITYTVAQHLLSWPIKSPPSYKSWLSVTGNLIQYPPYSSDIWSHLEHFFFYPYSDTNPSLGHCIQKAIVATLQASSE